MNGKAEEPGFFIYSLKLRSRQHLISKVKHYRYVLEYSRRNTVLKKANLCTESELSIVSDYISVFIKNKKLTVILVSFIQITEPSKAYL